MITKVIYILVRLQVIMVRKYFTLLIISFLINSCFPFKNEYQSTRFNSARFKLKPRNNDLYIKVIDLSSFYTIILNEDFIKKYNLENYIVGLKFYDNGRVGFFKDVDFSKPETFNPQKASMGYYNFDGNEFLIEFIFPGPALFGLKYSLSREEIIINYKNKDTLFVRTFKSARSSYKVSKYLKRKLPKEALIYKPDW